MTEKKNSLGTPFTRVPNMALTDFGLSPVEFMTYCAVLKHADKDTHVARPSHATLARIVGVSPRTIKRALVRLRALKLIQWNADSGGRGKSYQYMVLDITKAPKPDVVNRPQKSRKGDTTAQVGTQKGDTTDPLSDAKGGHRSTGADTKRMTNRTYKGGHQSTKKGDKPDTKRVTPQTSELDIKENKSLEPEILNKKKESSVSDSESPAIASDTVSMAAPSQSEQQRIMRKIMELTLAKQDAKTDDEREALTQRVEDYIAQLRTQPGEASAAGVGRSGGSADRRGTDRPGGTGEVRADRGARGLLPDQARHDLAGDERHAPARGGD